MQGTACSACLYEEFQLPLRSSCRLLGRALGCSLQQQTWGFHPQTWRNEGFGPAKMEIGELVRGGAPET